MFIEGEKEIIIEIPARCSYITMKITAKTTVREVIEEIVKHFVSEETKTDRQALVEKMVLLRAIRVANKEDKSS